MTEAETISDARPATDFRSGDRGASFVRLHESEAAGQHDGSPAVAALHRDIDGRGLDGSWVATNDPTVFQAAGYSHAVTLPVKLCLPAASARRVSTYEADETFLASRRFEAIASDLDDFPVEGWVQRWTPDGLRRRLRTKEHPALIHVTPWVVGVSMRSRLNGVPVAVLVKLLPRGGRGGARRAVDVVAAACRSHHVPIAVHAGVNNHAIVRGLRIPSSWFPAPTDVMFRPPNGDGTDDTSFDILELLDFDAL